MPGASQHCTTCGLRIAGSTCSACGGSATPLPLADGDPASGSAHAPDPTRPELELGFEAWKAGDAGRLLSQCLNAVGATALKLSQTPEGPAFKGILRGISVFARARAADGLIAIESPVVRLPLTQYVPALRLLLELSDRDATPVRYSVRRDLVLCRFVGTLAELSPAHACAAMEAVVAGASAGARLLVGALQARTIDAQGHADISVESIVRGQTPAVSEAPASPARGKKVALDSIPPLVDEAPAAEPTKQTPAVAMPSVSQDGIPAVLLPPGGLQAQTGQPPLRSKVPTPARIEQRPRMRSPAPGLGGASGLAPLKPPPGPSAPTPVQGVPAATAAAARRSEATAAPPPAPSTRPFPLKRPPLPGRAAQDKTLVSEATPPTAPSPAASPPPPQAAAQAPAAHAPAADPLADTFLGGALAARPVGNGPGAPLSELLHKSQTLGAVLSFADQPATMCLLIRATVYRAVLEHDKSVPNAVSALFHGTYEATKEIYITAPGKRRGAMAIPAAAPAFELMAHLTAHRCEVDEPAEPLGVTPITTAQEAKQHLARYVAEIDQAPTDPELRHFLALGALSELLVRTKLPGPTQDRLRGIVAHAQKEGAKPQAIELMMTALTRMMA